MKYFDNLKQLEAFTYDPRLDVPWPLEAIAIKGKHDAYCPRCGKMCPHDPVEKYKIRHCIFCHQQFFLYQKSANIVKPQQKSRFPILFMNRFLERRKNECS